MPIKRGVIRCKWCGDVADVMEAEGKRKGELYLICRCGTDQSNRGNRQQYYKDNMFESLDELTLSEESEKDKNAIKDAVLDTASEPVSNTVSDEAQDSKSDGLSVGKILGVIGCVGLVFLGVKR